MPYCYTVKRLWNKPEAPTSLKVSPSKRDQTQSSRISAVQLNKYSQTFHKEYMASSST